jgi:hypothetical protein
MASHDPTGEIGSNVMVSQEITIFEEREEAVYGYNT